MTTHAEMIVYVQDQHRAATESAYVVNEIAIVDYLLSRLALAEAVVKAVEGNYCNCAPYTGGPLPKGDLGHCYQCDDIRAALAAYRAEPKQEPTE